MVSLSARSCQTNKDMKDEMSQDFECEEQMISTTTETTTTVKQQKIISFLLVSCWYRLAEARFLLPSFRLIFTVFIFCRLSSILTPCQFIITLVFSAISCTFVINLSICYNSFRSYSICRFLTAYLSAYSNSPVNCCCSLR